MMNIYFAVAGGLMFVAGFLHLGTVQWRYPVLVKTFSPEAEGPLPYVSTTIRMLAVYDMMSFIGQGAMVMYSAFHPEHPLCRAVVIVIGVTCLLNGGVVALCTGGKHPGWFFACVVGILLFWGIIR